MKQNISQHCRHLQNKEIYDNIVIIKTRHKCMMSIVKASPCADLGRHVLHGVAFACTRQLTKSIVTLIETQYNWNM